MEKFTKIDSKVLEVEITKPTPEPEKIKYTLDELTKIRASIDVTEAEFMVRVNEHLVNLASEKEKYDKFISEAQKLGIISELEEVVIE